MASEAPANDLKADSKSHAAANSSAAHGSAGAALLGAPATVPAAISWPVNFHAGLLGLGNGLLDSVILVYVYYYLVFRGSVWELPDDLPLWFALRGVFGWVRLGAAPLARGGLLHKRFCIAAYLSSGVVAAVMLMKLRPDVQLPADVIESAAGYWALYFALEALGTVALLAWLGDLVPVEHRGLFLGCRQRWSNIGRLVGVLGGGLPAILYSSPTNWPVNSYLVPALIGAVLLTLAAVPLHWLPMGGLANNDAAVAEPRPQFRWRYLLTLPFDASFSRLLGYGCWVSFFAGLTVATLAFFPFRILELSPLWILGLFAAMTFGQALVSPQLGRWADRVGNRRVLLICQLITAAGFAGYMLANENRWWMIGVAWLAWVAHTGSKVGVTNLLLKLAPPGQAGSCVAMYFAITELLFGASLVLGNEIFNQLRGWHFFIHGFELNRYAYFSYFALMTQLLAALFVLAIKEPTPEKIRVGETKA